MDNSTGTVVQEGTSRDHKSEAINNLNENEENRGQTKTIIVPVAVNGHKPAKLKTDVTTATLVESVNKNPSNKSKDLCENVQQLNICDNKGQRKIEESQGNKNQSSIQKINMSESLSKLLAYGSSSEDTEPDSLTESESDSDDDSSINTDTQEQSNVIKTNDNLSSDNYNAPLAHFSDSSDIYSSDAESAYGIKSQNVKPAIKSRPKMEEVLGSEDNRSSVSYNAPSAHFSDSSDIYTSDAESADGAKSEPMKPAIKSHPKTDGELGIDDLPPVPDLSNLRISFKEGECIQMGNVTSIVDRFVMVESLPNMPAYDLDTLLFLDEGKRPLGHVHDVMGQVTSPIYVVRFNSKQEIESRGITKDLPVYSAPHTEHTQYVFLKELMKIKGTDASWRGDNEVPVEFVDFSDDEAEYSFSKQNLNEQDIFDKKRKRNSIEKHKMFESAMNLKNKVDTARHKMRDTCEPTIKRYMPQSTQQPPAFYYQPTNVADFRPQCNTSYPTFPPPNFPIPPPNYNFIGIAPRMLGMQPFNTPFGRAIPHFTPNPQPFPPPTFGPPSIPPLPAVSHLMSQPTPPPTFPVLPPNIAVLNMPKPQTNIPKTSKSPKSTHNDGVVPKAQQTRPKSRGSGLPQVYYPQTTEYQLPYPPNLGLPKATLPPFTSTPQSMPSIPPTFCPAMPPWPYNMTQPPHGNLGFQPHYSGGRPFQKQ
ncbi:hypothetical protein FQA39_LY11089 [Lamprigera yunnana]|nr:hypothetical protein FQA39_LY11089 [Lamprigera yunnana]